MPLPQSRVIESAERAISEALQALYDASESQSELAKRLGLSLYALRRLMNERGIQARSRGGANNVKVVLTPELLEEIQQDGVMTVARRLGVSDTAIRTKLRKLTAQVSSQNGTAYGP